MAGTLLPDVLPYEPGGSAGYPANGRALTDDVADHFLTVFTNGKVTADGVGPHGDLLAEFPFLGRRMPPTTASGLHCLASAVELREAQTEFSGVRNPRDPSYG